MKLSQFSVCLVVLVVCLLVLYADARKKKGNECRYAVNRQQKKGDCNPATGMMEVTLQLKKGDPTQCAPTKVKSKRCKKNNKANKVSKGSGKACRYDKSANWSECGPGVTQRTKVLTLKPGSPASCPTNKTKTKPCPTKTSKGA